MKITTLIGQKVNGFLFWLEEHYIGILTTVAVHLFIILIVLILKINAYVEQEYYVMIDLPGIDLTQERAELSGAEEASQAERESRQSGENEFSEFNMRNIPVNLAHDQAVENISKMVRDIKTEMNITDPQPKQDNIEPVEPETELSENAALLYEDKYPVNAAGERTIYTGPTTVSYELSDRRHAWMPFPAYKCQGQGKIVVDIVVNPGGRIISAEINKSKSESQDLCMIDAAKRDAERSRFNNSPTAPARQQGSITYVFIAQ